MSKTKTVNLIGVETKVDFGKPFAYVECSNLSDGDILMSTKSNFERGDDDVTIVKSGSTATIGDIGTPSIKTVYLNGSGEVQLVGKGYAQSSFKRARKGGENHINDGLAYEFGSVNDTCETKWSGSQFLYTPFTIEFCGSYKNFYSTISGIGTGRWFIMHNGAQSSFAASQRENVFQCRIFGTWFDTGETDITIEKNEFVTISMVITQQNTVDLYKNGEFVKYLDIPNYSVNSFSGLVFWTDPFVSSRGLIGIIESFRIYDRELTESEILHNFNADKALYFKEG